MTTQIADNSSFDPIKINWVIIFWGLAFLSAFFVFWDGLAYMFQDWQREEYSHGILIPLISIYLMLQKFPQLESINSRGSFFGSLLGFLGLLGFALGELSALYIVIQYSFILLLTGLVISFWGIKGLKILWVPLFYLVFMIPLPNFLYLNLSAKLQLLSSAIGVDVLRLMGVSVYLEGNIIDLGTFRLQVVDACSGLRYLFPLMSFGFLVAYLYRAALWKKSILFLSTIPITILMNSLRITLVGVTVDIWGIKAAEGFLHDFQGWVVFMICLAVLAGEILLMHKLSGQKTSSMEALNVNLPKPLFKLSYLKPSKSFELPSILILVLLILAIPFKLTLSERKEVLPERSSFVELPLNFGSWVGRESSLDQDTIDTLKLKDYIVVNYTTNESNKNLSYINLYMAYYDNQRKGASIHSPKTCLPGGGWEIKNFDVITLKNIQAYPNRPLSVNRVMIQKGESKQLVYYWFQQRGRIITNEYAAKWFIFWDSLTRSRTDGALVRFTVPLSVLQDESKVEKELQEFIANVTPGLARYIPE